MWRNQSVSALAFLIASGLLLVPGPAGAKEKDHPKRLQFTGIVRIDENLHASVVGTVGPPLFFESLRAKESPEGTTFLNDSGVRFFPRQMTITLRIIGPVAADGRSISSTKLNPEQMQGLRFKGQWKRGMALRPVREFRLLSASEANLIDLLNSGRPVDSWTYEMVLEDSQVPVTDHLILYILSPEIN